jgi:hypothetical protein
MEDGLFNVYEEVEGLHEVLIQKGYDDKVEYSLKAIQKWENLPQAEVAHLPDPLRYSKMKADNYPHE